METCPNCGKIKSALWDHCQFCHYKPIKYKGIIRAAKAPPDVPRGRQHSTGEDKRKGVLNEKQPTLWDYLRHPYGKTIATPPARATRLMVEAAQAFIAANPQHPVVVAYLKKLSNEKYDNKESKPINTPPPFRPLGFKEWKEKFKGSLPAPPLFQPIKIQEPEQGIRSVESELKRLFEDAIGKFNLDEIITFWATVKNVVSLFEAYGKVKNKSVSYLIHPEVTFNQFGRVEADVGSCEIWTEDCDVDDEYSIAYTNQQIEGRNERLEATVFINDNAKTTIILENGGIVTIDELRDILVKDTR